MSVEDGEGGEPEKHGVGFAAEEGKGSSDQPEGGEGGAEEEIRRVAAEDVEDLAGGQLGVGCVHRSE